MNENMVKKEISSNIEVSTHDETAQLPKAAKKGVVFSKLN